MWDAEDSPVPPAPARDAIEEDRAADKARIAKLEQEVLRLTKFTFGPNGAREQFKWTRGALVWAEQRFEEFDERLRGLEDFFGMPTGDWQGISLYDGQDVSAVHRIRNREERDERDAQLLAAYEMTEEERQRRERQRREEEDMSEEESSDNGNKEGEDESREVEKEGREVEAKAVERAPPSKRLRPLTAETSPATSRTPSSSRGSRSTSPTADRRMEADGPPAMPSARARSRSTSPTADRRMEADGPPAMPSARASSPTTPTIAQVPAVNVILATPQSSQHPTQSQTAAIVSTACPQPGPLPPSSGAGAASPVPHAEMPPTPPWRINSNSDVATGANVEAIPPAAHWVVVRPPASMLLTVPAPDAGKSNQSRRSRSRSPSPGPVRRSPRLQSPSPQGRPAAPAAQGTDGESGASMDVDK
jgi:hypothetical protein